MLSFNGATKRYFSVVMFMPFKVIPTFVSGRNSKVWPFKWKLWSASSTGHSFCCVCYELVLTERTSHISDFFFLSEVYFYFCLVHDTFPFMQAFFSRIQKVIHDTVFKDLKYQVRFKAFSHFEEWSPKVVANGTLSRYLFLRSHPSLACLTRSNCSRFKFSNDLLNIVQGCI